MSSVYIAAGVTSNIFTALFPALLKEGYAVFATVRPETRPERIAGLGQMGPITFLTHEEAMERREHFSRILWLSTHDDPVLLERFTKTETPTLAISSGAIMDFYRGLQPEETLNGYQRSKLALGRVPGIYIVVPGFYIEDVPTPVWASKGLHGDSTRIIFSGGYDDDGFDWSKGYSVTPKSFMVNALVSWLRNPGDAPRNQPIIVCSDRIYRRAELRWLGVPERAESSLGDAIHKRRVSDLEPIYQRFYHVATLTHEMIELACRRAASLTQRFLV